MIDADYSFVSNGIFKRGSRPSFKTIHKILVNGQKGFCLYIGAGIAVIVYLILNTYVMGDILLDEEWHILFRNFQPC